MYTYTHTHTYIKYTTEMSCLKFVLFFYGTSRVGIANVMCVLSLVCIWAVEGFRT